VPDLDQILKTGAFSKKQILCKDHLISWAHGSRFRIGLELGRRFMGKRILDFGCGDATFLAMLLNQSERPRVAVGAEVAPDFILTNTERLAGIPALSFVHVNELNRPEHVGGYDGLFCMEVLEHVPEPDRFLRQFQQLLAPGGTLLISVPVETGPALLVKQIARQIAGWRGLGDYPGQQPYTGGEFIRSVFAGKSQHIERQAYCNPDGSLSYSHKGFNWKVLRQLIADRFVVSEIVTSPVRRLPAAVSSQVWIVAKKP
jgi:SAM-dependent methyltransferase